MYNEEEIEIIFLGDPWRSFVFPYYELRPQPTRPLGAVY
jgi:hypothetical protein